MESRTEGRGGRCVCRRKGWCSVRCGRGCCSSRGGVGTFWVYVVGLFVSSFESEGQRLVMWLKLVGWAEVGFGRRGLRGGR